MHTLFYRITTLKSGDVIVVIRVYKVAKTVTSATHTSEVENEWSKCYLRLSSVRKQFVSVSISIEAGRVSRNNINTATRIEYTRAFRISVTYNISKIKNFFTVLLL